MAQSRRDRIGDADLCGACLIGIVIATGNAGIVHDVACLRVCRGSRGCFLKIMDVSQRSELLGFRKAACVAAALTLAGTGFCCGDDLLPIAEIVCRFINCVATGTDLPVMLHVGLDLFVAVPKRRNEGVS